MAANAIEVIKKKLADAQYDVDAAQDELEDAKKKYAEEQTEKEVAEKEHAACLRRHKLVVMELAKEKEKLADITSKMKGIKSPQSSGRPKDDGQEEDADELHAKLKIEVEELRKLEGKYEELSRKAAQIDKDMKDVEVKVALRTKSLTNLEGKVETNVKRNKKMEEKLDKKGDKEDEQLEELKKTNQEVIEEETAADNAERAVKTVQAEIVKLKEKIAAEKASAAKVKKQITKMAEKLANL